MNQAICGKGIVISCVRTPESGRAPTPHFPLLSSICKTAIYMKSIEKVEFARTAGQGAKRPIWTKKNIVTKMWQGSFVSTGAIVSFHWGKETPVADCSSVSSFVLLYPQRSKSNLRFMSTTNTQATPAMIGKTKTSWHSKSNGTEVPATQSKQYFLTWLYAFYTFLYHLYHNKFIKAPFKGWKIAMARHEADVYRCCAPLSL